jgi:hypothetical protein
MAGPAKAVRASAFVPVAGLRKRAAGSSPLLSSLDTRKPATCKSRISDNLDFRSFRKTLESLLVDIRHCLSVIDQLGEGLLGHGPKQPVFRPKLKNRSTHQGSSFFRHKSKGPPPAQVTSALASDLKGKAPLVLPNLRPKLVYKAKVGSGPISSNPGASSSSRYRLLCPLLVVRQSLPGPSLLFQAQTALPWRFLLLPLNRTPIRLKLAVFSLGPERRSWRFLAYHRSSQCCRPLLLRWSSLWSAFSTSPPPWRRRWPCLSGFSPGHHPWSGILSLL